jgi:hypothetical protein
MKPKINYSRIFSSLRAFRRYIICNFSSSFDPFSIFSIGFCSNRVSNGETSAGKKRQCFCPCGTHCQRKEQNGRDIVVRVSRVHVVRAHTSYLMRNKHGTPSSSTYSFLSNKFPAPKLPLFCLAAPVCTQLGL